MVATYYPYFLEICLTQANCALVGDAAEGTKTPADPAYVKYEEEVARKRPKEEVPQDAEAQVPLEEPAALEEDFKRQTEAQPLQPATDIPNSAFDFILNADLEEAVEDYSSSEEESD